MSKQHEQEQQQQQHATMAIPPPHQTHHHTTSATDNTVSGRSNRSTMSLPLGGSGKRHAPGQGLEGTDGLPPNWWAHEDPESGETYYFNR